MRAIRINPLIIEAIPKKEHTQEMCDAFLTGGDVELYLEDVDVEARSRILCISCLKANRGPVNAVPRLLWDAEIIAADHTGKLLEAAS